MNAMIDPAGIPSGSNFSPTSNLSEPQSGTIFTLRRTGRKPVRFEGWQLVEAIGTTVAKQVRHELNIYRTVKGGIVVELIVRRSSPEHQDLFRVKTFEDLDAAAAWLENHRAAEDVPIPAELGATETGLTWAVLQAVQMRQCIERIEADYQALLSEVFAALDLADSAEI